MQLVVPMAGLGRRFADAGYELPKPLIPIDGTPMVVCAVRDLPKAERMIFVCHPEHVARYQIDRVLESYFPDCKIVVPDGTTAGQACSVRLAAPWLDPCQPVLVAACDNSHIYQSERFASLVTDREPDAVIWTYRGDPRVLVKPQWYGWVAADSDGNATQVKVKTPVSADPINDHVVSGCFWFRSGRTLLEGIDELVARGLRVNGEFYLDSVPGLLLEQGRRVAVFEVDKYIGWGTPDDLKSYLQWQQYFRQRDRAADDARFAECSC